MSFWRQVGFSYPRYASMCAQVTRKSLKEPMRTQAMNNRDSVNVAIVPWVNGKPVRPDLHITADKISKSISIGK
jgi:hypothetical protein